MQARGADLRSEDLPPGPRDAAPHRVPPDEFACKEGDLIEIGADEIGVLRNPVISWEKAYGQKPAALATQEKVK